jgi:hypothetical protein
MREQIATRFVAAPPDDVFGLIAAPALHPATFSRRLLPAKVRASQLQRRELPASLRALASVATTAHNA